MFHFTRFPTTWVAPWVDCPYQADGFPHSETSGSKVACHLPEVYRRLLRPSSAFYVEASSVRPYAALSTTETRKRASVFIFWTKDNCDCFVATLVLN